MNEGGCFTLGIPVSVYRRFLRVGLFVVVCTVISSTNLYASSGTEGAAFLDIPVGAGPAAMGSAYTALARDAYAPVYNPAGLGFVTAPELAAQHLSYLESLHYEFGSFVLPLARAQESGSKPQNSDGVPGALGASVQYLGTSDIPGLNPDGTPASDFSAHYGAYSLAYGRQLTDHLALGLTGKAIEAKIADVSAKAYAGDLGALYAASDRLMLSTVIDNLGSKLTFTSQGDTLPSAFHAGAAYRLDSRWKTSAEAVYSHTGQLAGRFGTEWRPLDSVALRAGYRTDTTSLSALAGLTAGLGARLFGQELSYAWLPYGDLGDTHYFSILLRFGKTEEERRNLIEYRAIKPHRAVKDKPDEIERNDPDFEQLIQLLEEGPDKDYRAESGGPPKQP